MNRETTKILARIFNKMWIAKSNKGLGVNKGIKIFRDEVISILEAQHALENPEVLDDDMPEHFDVWLVELLEGDEQLGTIIN